MKTFTFSSSSNPSKKYETRVDDDGHVTCTCPGYTYRGKCKHTAYVQSGPIIGRRQQTVSTDVLRSIYLALSDGDEDLAGRNLRLVFPAITDTEVAGFLTEVGEWKCPSCDAKGFPPAVGYTASGVRFDGCDFCTNDGGEN